MKNTKLGMAMGSHYNCDVALCTNYSRKNTQLLFYRIPKNKGLRKEHKRLIQKQCIRTGIFAYTNLFGAFRWK